MALTLDEVRTAPIFIVIVLILINGFVNHLIYKDSVIFLFEKGMTNRQRREWRKEKYFKRKTMRYIRATIKSLPQQKFSPNIEKYHLADVVSIVVSIITFALLVICKYFVNIQNRGLHFCLYVSNSWNSIPDFYGTISWYLINPVLKVYPILFIIIYSTYEQLLRLLVSL